MTSPLAASVRQVLTHWAELGITVASARPERWLDVEGDLACTLPIEMRSLYSHSNGTDGHDEQTLRFLPIEEWVRATSFASAGHEDEHADCVVFAEHSIWAHEYAVRCRDRAVVLIWGGLPVQVAASFDEFLIAYLSDPPSLFPRIP